jgi:hypothetical protein
VSGVKFLPRGVGALGATVSTESRGIGEPKSAPATTARSLRQDIWIWMEFP